MREIKEMNLEHLEEYIEIAYNSYPSFKDNSLEGVEDFRKLATMRITDPSSHFIGMFENDKLIAAMRIIDFQMNYFNKMVPASGIASLGVHLMYKKQKIAKAMVDYYEEYYYNKDVPFALLLPFTPEFYKNMGYGLGPKMNQYRIYANRVPACFDNADIRYVKENSDIEDLLKCHERCVAKTHGMLLKMIEEVNDLYENKDNRIIANYSDDGIMDGYMIFEFENGKDDNYTINNMRIKEFVYETTSAFNRLLGFIRKQADQVNLVIFNTQDEYFAHKFDNPLNDSLNYIDFGNLETNTQAIGVMYKIINVKKAFELHNYRNYNNVNLKAKLIITNENNLVEEIIIKIDNGHLTLDQKEFDVTLNINLVDFSSLFLGCISIKGLNNLGLITLDKPSYLETLDLAFYCNQKPICNTDF